MKNPQFIDSIEAAVDHVRATIKGDIVLGIPLGVGKPNPFVNALYRRIQADPARHLRQPARRSGSATALSGNPSTRRRILSGTWPKRPCTGFRSCTSMPSDVRA